MKEFFFFLNCWYRPRTRLLNTALLLYTLQHIIALSTAVPLNAPTEFKAEYSWMPRAHPPTILFTT